MTDLRRAREERFADLYDATYADVLRFVQRRAGPGRAEDVVHEAFLVAWRRLDDVPPRPDDARAWLFGTARRCLLNDRRGEARRDALMVRIATAPSSAEQLTADDVARHVDLAAAWRRLTADEQEVLALAVWEDLPSPQAGRVLGISAVAYRLRLHRARRRLRRLLDPEPAPGATTAGSAPTTPARSLAPSTAPHASTE
ncbi:sigma-70 family RNA polymerase sigma factor [Cellulomonas sp. APG4]|uniref:RNA polymerase sigma factor n=1 Tax=Cellulomonas sp. APG4 TaxID=1538656 RepID=UPI00137AA57A|nr:sigma-70 family RNA polymerase sigma factor [Cellulomonas sp. APG4]